MGGLTACGSRTAVDTVPVAENQPPPGVAPDAGPVVTLSLAPGSVPWNLAIDAEHVYWTVETGGDVMRVPIGGGTTTTIYAGGNRSPNDLAASGTGSVVVALDSTVIVVPTGGGAAVTLSTSWAWGVAADATYAYWTEAGMPARGQICRAPLTGGAVSTLADGAWTPGAITVDAEFAYWIAFTDTTRSYLKVSLAGGALSTLATVPGSDTPADFLALGSNGDLYSTDTGTGTLLAIPLAGGAASSVSPSLAGLAAYGVAVDGPWAYVGANTTGPDFSLMAVPLASPSNPQVAWSGKDIYSVRADATNLYWTVPRGGAVLQMPKASRLTR